MLSPRTKTPIERKLWSLIEMLAHQRDMNDDDLAAVAHSSVVTVRRDRNNPRGMSADRLYRYLSIGLSEEEIYSALLKAIAEKE